MIATSWTHHEIKWDNICKVLRSVSGTYWMLCVSFKSVSQNSYTRSIGNNYININEWVHLQICCILSIKQENYLLIQSCLLFSYRFLKNINKINFPFSSVVHLFLGKQKSLLAKHRYQSFCFCVIWCFKHNGCPISVC